MAEREPRDGDERGDWVDRATAVARWLGLNPIKVRWKLEAWRGRMQARRDELAMRAELVRRRQQNCPQCGRLSEGGERRCPSCGASLEGRTTLALRRIGLALPDFVSVSSLLAVAILAVYARTAGAQADAGWFELRIDTLVRFGGQWPPLVDAGEWWRLGTAIFLHAGVLHLVFNLLALSQVGPAVETIFGRSRMLFFFMLTGLLASLASYAVGRNAVSIGASGAIMGLIGVAAGWGHRAGTGRGRDIRNRMLQWAVYTMLFGLMIGADNAAHLGGFVAGAGLGLVSRPVWSDGPWRRRLAPLLGLTGFAAAAAAVTLTLAPPVEHGTADEAETVANNAELRRLAEPYKRACAEYRAGRPEAARAALRGGSLEGLAGADASPDLLEELCDGIDDLLERCRRFPVEGLAVFQTPPADLRLRTQLEATWRTTCEAWND
ncbi:MAG: rhomboid family intramembrane serine protease [Deltaproteobacteria bacterium]|nr:rhomboid family intramembrane serine protease [Deltaproteobacteria bacterium]